MKVITRCSAILAAMILSLSVAPAFAQQSAAASGQAPVGTAYSDPIVQKRMEVRDANQQYRAKKAEAKKGYKAQVRQAKSERNQTVQESRAQAQDSLNQSN